MLVISARLAPLPPRRFFISARPSALPLPKKYTDLAIAASLLEKIIETTFRKCTDGICQRPTGCRTPTAAEVARPESSKGVLNQPEAASGGRKPPVGCLHTVGSRDNRGLTPPARPTLRTNNFLCKGEAMLIVQNAQIHAAGANNQRDIRNSRIILRFFATHPDACYNPLTFSRINGSGAEEDSCAGKVVRK